MKIRDIEAKPGMKKSGYISVRQTSDYPASTVRMPITIVKGSSDGPTLCLTAGMHPTEYAGIDAVIRICRQIEPEDLIGTIIGVPVVNMPGFEKRAAHVNPIDNVNLTDVYPGKPNGSISEEIIHVLFEEVISRADHWIDLHGGDMDERQMEAYYTFFPRVGDRKVDTTSEAMARAYNFTHIALVTYPRLVVAAKKGVSCIVAESGESGVLTDRLETDITNHVNGVTNVMKYLRMIKGTPCITVKQMFADKLFFVRSAYGGLFFPCVRLGDTVSKHQTVGEVLNLQGDRIGKVTTQFDGVIRFMYTWHLIREGDVVMGGFVSPTPVSPFPEVDRFSQGTTRV